MKLKAQEAAVVDSKTRALPSDPRQTVPAVYEEKVNGYRMLAYKEAGASGFLSQ